MRQGDFQPKYNLEEDLEIFRKLIVVGWTFDRLNAGTV
jgi:hypothetical protein